LLRRGFGPREVVVDDACRVLVVRLHAPTDSPHPCTMHLGRQYAKMKWRCLLYN
jgi:hypothetical protein